MANGTTNEKLARADRIREKSGKAQYRAEQNRKATQNAIAALREANLPGSHAYRESDSEITANTSGLHAKGIPSHAWRAISIGIAGFLIALGVAVARALW